VERCDDKLQLQARVVLIAVQFAFDVGLQYVDVELSFKALLSLLMTKRVAVWHLWGIWLMIFYLLRSL
jgi:hypothetical protein